MPYSEQHLGALMLERIGYLDMSDDEKRSLAAEIGKAMERVD